MRERRDFSLESSRTEHAFARANAVNARWVVLDRRHEGPEANPQLGFGVIAEQA